MITRKFFAIALALTVVVTASFTYLLTASSNADANVKKTVAKKAVDKAICPPDFLRLNLGADYRYISPLLLTEISCVSPEMDSLRMKVTQLINEKKKVGTIQQASVYLKTIKDGKWFEVNGNQFYNPGSLMKLAILLTYLREEEKNPGLLEKELLLSSKIPGPGIDQIRTSAPLELNKKYTIKKLLEEMIVNSDNDATQLLNLNINRVGFTQVMADLGTRTTDIEDPNFEMTVLEYNRYFRVLYNASYLNRKNSEWALDLLTRANYKNAFMKGIPEGVTAAHKFGERPYENGFNFHEAGVVYLKSNPYLLVVMTRGADNTKLPNVVAEISRLCYDEMSGS